MGDAPRSDDSHASVERHALLLAAALAIVIPLDDVGPLLVGRTWQVAVYDPPRLTPT